MKITVVVGLLFVLSPRIFAQDVPQVVTLKNGIQYSGRVATIASFPAENVNPWNNANQIALVDDGLRRLFFNRNSAANLAPLDENHPIANPTVFDIPQRVYTGVTKGFGNLRIGLFDEHGHRNVQSTTTEGTSTFVQGITRITPWWCDVETLANSDGEKMRNWSMKISTSSVPPDVLRHLLESQIRDRNNPAEYLTIVDFFKESDQFKEALDELSFVAERFPDIEDQIREQQDAIRQARARQWVRQVRKRIEVGQPILAGSMLSAFDRGGIAGEILAEMADVQTELDSAAPRVEAGRKTVVDLIDSLLGETPGESLEPDQIPMLQRFKQELESEMNVQNAPRLDAFTRFASDPQMSALQKLSLAISGWFLGSNNATENFAVSQSFFAVRDLVIEYLTSADAGRRRQILEDLAKYEGGEPVYLAAMISLLKPTHAPDLTNHDVSQPLSFEFEISGSKADNGPLGFSYHVQLPPEYDPYRRYPCIFTLPGDKDIEQQLFRWCGPFNDKLGIRQGQAMANGYIVVCVDWKLPQQFAYDYTDREHLAILTAYRKVIRQFSIDTDRVYLTGHGFGADAAYDIGISHPDHWAGIVGISGKIDRYPDLYREHKHVGLPIYSVVGEKDLDSKRASEGAWNRWLPSRSFFDCTVVEYKGRSNEPFLEEIVEIFKWTQGHRRRLPDRSGFELECDVRRPWDNYFWFYELHGIPLDKVVWPYFYGRSHPSPVTMIGKLKPNQVNSFFIGPPNQGSGATVWLSPDYVDFNQPIVISGRGDFKDFVSPSRMVLLEDVRGRGDRQHPYWANVHCRGKKWEPNVVE